MQSCCDSPPGRTPGRDRPSPPFPGPSGPGLPVQGTLLLLTRSTGVPRRRESLLPGSQPWTPDQPGPATSVHKCLQGTDRDPDIKAVIFLCLSKSLGLIEGYGGRGKGGLPATLSPAEEEKAKGPHEKYGYNSYLSEKISLDRSIPDYRPTNSAEPESALPCLPGLGSSSSRRWPSTGDACSVQRLCSLAVPRGLRPCRVHLEDTAWLRREASRPHTVLLENKEGETRALDGRLSVSVVSELDTDP
ncbi:hypothetical protein GHT09_002830 [Marmota monax]|uniref:Uncharacterized protein n=1 Tax=Marmota monax TaxID=9995 RepID=A0A834PVT1_MARMO|nr:hypothetical protein GHT09_002830 [Marmota monax]